MKSGAKPAILFLGTPQFAVETLLALIQTNQYSIVGVVTQPDKPAGRGKKITACPVKECAAAHGLPVYQPHSIKRMMLGHGNEQNSEESRLLALLHKTQFDAFIVIAFGQLLPHSFFSLPRCGTINVHASILPRWRGAAPIQHAIFHGDGVSGVSIMQIEEQLDAGPVFGTRSVALAADETYGSLHDKLSKLGSELLTTILPQIITGGLTAAPQPLLGVSFAPKWENADQTINWQDECEVTLRRIRACAPHPGARTTLREMPIKVYRAHQVSGVTYPETEPGSVVDKNRSELIVYAPGGYISLDEMQLPGRKPLKTSEILKGTDIPLGTRFY